MALHEEKNCALALVEKYDNEKCVAFYDTTTRKNIKGD
jgi:hypothetical protein